MPGGATTTFAYDGMSRLTQQVDPAITNAATGVGHQRLTRQVSDVWHKIITRRVAGTAMAVGSGAYVEENILDEIRKFRV